MNSRVFGIVAAALGRNRLRTALAILGVGVGIAAVVATAALGGASAARVESQITALGDDFLWIRAGNRNLAGVRTGSGGARTLTQDDARALAEEIPEIASCSPRITGREQIIAGSQNWNTTYRGVSSAFFDIRNRDAADGAVFGEFDEADHARVLVLGQTVAERLFGEGREDAVGRTVRMGRFLFRIIGVLASKGTGTGGLDRDDTVFLPASTVKSSLNKRMWVDDVMCSVVSPAFMNRAELDALTLLRERHGLRPDEPDDFELQQPLETLRLRAETAESLRLLLIGIGSISLVVGGVGIMNIMLVSVTERRREIGVRLAIGARSRDVRLQFLLEAAAIGLLGGVVGIVLGVGMSWSVASYMNSSAVISPALIAWVTVSAVVAGVVFGYLPAHRASALDPIEAMRAEK